MSAVLKVCANTLGGKESKQLHLVPEVTAGCVGGSLRKKQAICTETGQLEGQIIVAQVEKKRKEFSKRNYKFKVIVTSSVFEFQKQLLLSSNML